MPKRGAASSGVPSFAYSAWQGGLILEQRSNGPGPRSTATRSSRPGLDEVDLLPLTVADVADHRAPPPGRSVNRNGLRKPFAYTFVQTWVRSSSARQNG